MTDKPKSHADRADSITLETKRLAALESRSAAPKPIRPLPNRPMVLPPKAAPPLPNWVKWSNMLDVELWQAVALTLDCEPDRLPVYLGAYDLLGDDPFKICPPEFRERLDIANSQGGVALPLKPVHELKTRCVVHLPTFVVWAETIWHDLPTDLKSIPSPPSANELAQLLISTGDENGKGVGGKGLVWTPARKAEARAYREKHGLKQTAAKYKVSQTTISKHIPPLKVKPENLGPWGNLGKG